MNRTTVFWLAALACTTSAFGARAQDIQTPAPPTAAPGTSGAPGNTGEGATSLETLDRNSDGKISGAEARANPDLARKFNALDRDNSGALDQGEFARFEVGGETSPVDERSGGGTTAESDSDASRDPDAPR